MSEPTDNAATENAAQTQTNDNAEEKSLAFSSMDEPKTEENPEAKDNAKDESGEPEDNDNPEKASGEENGGDEVDYSQIKAPDGFEMDQEVMAQVVPILKDLKCSKENAEKIVAAGADIFNKAIKTQAEAFFKKVADWEKEVRADKELGLDENIAIANRAVLEFGDERLTKEIIETGLGNHPAFVRFCYSVGKAICEDTVVSASGSAKASNRNELGEPMLSFKGMD